MAIPQTSLRSPTIGPNQGLGEPKGSKASGLAAGEPLIGPSPRPRSGLIFFAIFFAAGLLLGGLAALALMPGLFAALIPAPVQQVNIEVSRSQVSEPSSVPSLFTQPFFIASLVLAFAPWLVAIGVIGTTRLRSSRKSTGAESAKGEPQASTKEVERAVEEPAEEPPAPNQEQGADTPLEDKLEEQPPELPAPEEKVELEEAIKEDEEEEEEDQPVLGDLASLFEEEDTSLASLEALSKGLAEINVEELIGVSSETSRKLLAANTERFNRSVIRDELERL